MPKLIDIIKSVGAGIIREVVPGGGLLIGAINAVLPADKKLPATATGQDIDYVIKGLPRDQRAAILNKEFDIELAQIKEGNATLRVMLEQDAKNPHSTRPKIALGAFRVVAFSCITVISVWSYGVLTGDSVLVKAVMDGWAFILAAIAPLTVLLQSYFGVLNAESRNRLDAANGTPTSGITGIAGLISSFIKR